MILFCATDILLIGLSKVVEGSTPLNSVSLSMGLKDCDCLVDSMSITNSMLKEKMERKGEERKKDKRIEKEMSVGFDRFVVVPLERKIEKQDP